MRTPLIAVAVAASLAGASAAPAADLSPARWPAATRAALETRDYYFFTPYPASVEGRRMLVTATGSAVATHAGLEALRHGGTAADAAATVALTQVSSRLGSIVSYAGVLKLTYFEAKTGRVYSLDAGWGTYRGETDPAGIPPTDISVLTGVPAPKDAGTGPLGRQTLVPGFMAGIEAMHQRFGRQPFADLFQPAIWYAENGITLSPMNAEDFRTRQTYLWRTAAGRRFASMPDGSLPKAGDLFRQPDLAKTLRAVASHGAGYMYRGDWAGEFVAAVNAQGGKATPADLADYRAQWTEPLSVAFAGNTVYAPGGGLDGSCGPLHALNLLSGQHVEAMGPYWRDPKAFVAYLDAVRFAQFAVYAPSVNDWERSQGFSPDCRNRLTPAYGAVVGPQIRGLLTPPPPPAAAPVSNHTDSVIVVDRWGNVAVLVHSTNSSTFGDAGIVIGGIPIGDPAAINRDRLSGVRPGEHVPSLMTPLLALRDAKPSFALAGVGAGVAAETVRLSAGVLGQRTDLRTLMEAPPLLAAFDPTGGALWNWREGVPAGAYDPAFREAVEALGVHLKEEAPGRVANMRGWSVVAAFDRSGGAVSTVETPGMFGVAESDVAATVEAPREVKLPVGILDRYVGDYDIGPNFHIHVYRVGDRLLSKATDRREVEIFPSSETTFFEKVENVQVTYQLDARNQVTQAILRLPNGSNVVAARRRPAEVR